MPVPDCASASPIILVPVTVCYLSYSLVQVTFLDYLLQQPVACSILSVLVPFLMCVSPGVSLSPSVLVQASVYLSKP